MGGSGSSRARRHRVVPPPLRCSARPGGLVDAPFWCCHGRNRFLNGSTPVIFFLGSVGPTVLLSWCGRHFTRPFFGLLDQTVLIKRQKASSGRYVRSMTKRPRPSTRATGHDRSAPQGRSTRHQCQETTRADGGSRPKLDQATPGSASVASPLYVPRERQRPGCQSAVEGHDCGRTARYVPRGPLESPGRIPSGPSIAPIAGYLTVRSGPVHAKHKKPTSCGEWAIVTGHVPTAWQSVRVGQAISSRTAVPKQRAHPLRRAPL